MLPFRHGKHPIGKQLVQSSRAILAAANKVNLLTLAAQCPPHHLYSILVQQSLHSKSMLTAQHKHQSANTQLHRMFKDTLNCVVLQLVTVQLFTVNATKQMTYAPLRPSLCFPLTSVLPVYGPKKVTLT